MVLRLSASPLAAALVADGDPATDKVDGILKAVRAHLGMDVAFVSEFLDGRRYFRNIDSAGAAPMEVGDSSPFDEGYCQRVVDGRLPQLIPDTAMVPEAMAIPVTTALPVGAHLSVPIRLRDGQVYGTFCCVSYAPDTSLNDRDIGVMRAFADLTAIEIQREVDARRERDDALRRINAAIDEQQMSLAYQPIYTLDAHRIAGLECLARFSAAPQRSPDVWFAEATNVGLGVRLELAAFQMALASLPLLPAGVHLAVNVSPAAVLTGEVAHALDGVLAGRIILEVTEHAAIDDYEELSTALAGVRAKGVRLAVDDAGAGYASFRHILNLRPDIIKLDMSLTREIDRDVARRALAAALIGFARETGSLIVAEGIETVSELDAVRALGAHMGQGYYLGRPMPIDRVADLLTREAA